jgi:dipeptidyl aminopeptidase/acylaminoacyl peptidase
LIVARTIGLSQIALDGDDVYWIESRPAEAGRNVIVRRTPDGSVTDINPQPFNARTRVHEYGGGVYVVDAGTIYFSNFSDQRLYQVSADTPPEAITPEGRMRYADGVIDRKRKRMICVREDHNVGESQQPVNAIVAVDLDGDSSGGRVLVSGNDFYASPRLDPEGTQLAWQTWNHPNMPWDGCELWLAEVTNDGSLANHRRVAGSMRESIFQPEWSPDGMLYFVSDRTGWWNLYRLKDGAIEPLYPMEVEFGLPQWVFGATTYAFESAQRIVCSYWSRGRATLALLNTKTRQVQPIDSPYTNVGNVRAAKGRAVFRAGSPTESSSIAQLDLAKGKFTTLKKSSDLVIDPGYISIAQAIEFPTENGLTAHAFFYPPQNKDFTAPTGELPPMLVEIHGGPTGATSASLSLDIQYWTSRGIAVLDVNYGGSTGYGRPYRERLNEQWGVVDVDDCVNGARYLAEQGLVDGNRLMITGGSAGGYTTLCALTFRNVFKAGASHFGVSDAEALARDTHKFESRYLDNLIGPYPERRDLYIERSPLHAAHRISAPLLLLQGLDDPVVPPNQSEAMFVAVRNKELPTAYVTFEGEQHGFRKAENIKRALEAELYFYSRVFGFELADEIEPIRIENLD